MEVMRHGWRDAAIVDDAVERVYLRVICIASLQKRMWLRVRMVARGKEFWGSGLYVMSAELGVQMCNRWVLTLNDAVVAVELVAQRIEDVCFGCHR